MATRFFRSLRSLTLGVAVLCSFPTLAVSAQTSIQPRPGDATLRQQQKDPAKAALLSLLYPGAGQFYVGNNPQRSAWILGGGSAILGGSLVGYGILADRPAESVAFGNLLITGVLLGYHLWNVRDAYDQAALYNKSVEERSRLSAQPFDSPTPFEMPALNAQLHQPALASTTLLSWSTQF